MSTEFQFDPDYLQQYVGQIFDKLSDKENQGNDAQIFDRKVAKSDVLQELNLNVPEQFLDALSDQMLVELGDVSEITQSEFLSLFTSFLRELQHKDGAHFDQSFAELCSTSFGGSCPDISHLSQGNSSASSDISDMRPPAVKSPKSIESLQSSELFYVPSPIRAVNRSLSFSQLNRLNYTESFSIGSYSGFGGTSPAKTLKEASSMELHNSKLNSELDTLKSKSKQYQSENEKLISSLEATEKELKSTQQKLVTCEKQLKMVRITNDNLNADLEMVNDLRTRDKAQMKRVEELEALVQSTREENEKAWNVVHELRSEKEEILTDVEEEKANYILLKQEMTLKNQEALREQKELGRQRDIQRNRAADSEARLLQFNRDIESLTRERDELKSVVGELESRIGAEGEVIQFTDSSVAAHAPQRTLFDELDQSKDYRAFKLEEIGAMKAKLDEANAKVTRSETKKSELEDQVRRLKHELKAVGAIHQAAGGTTRRQPINVRLKHAETNTERERTTRVSDNNLRLSTLSWREKLVCLLVVLLASSICIISSVGGPLLQINCPAGFTTFY